MAAFYAYNEIYFFSTLLVFSFDHDNVAKVFSYDNVYQTSEIDKLND